MRLFGLMLQEPETEGYEYFKIRRAERLEDYLVALLVEAESEHGARTLGEGELFEQLLEDVVLRHVFAAKGRSVKVAGPAQCARNETHGRQDPKDPKDPKDAKDHQSQGLTPLTPTLFCFTAVF